MLREISNYYYRTNGIYFRAVNTFATFYRYDWYVTPEIVTEPNNKEDKILKEFNFLLNFLDQSNIRKTCADIATNVIINGAYYGYIADDTDRITLQ